MTKPPIAAPEARARLVVTLPFRPSKLEEALESIAPDGAPALTDTQEAFNHIARRSKDRLVVVTPFIDPAARYHLDCSNEGQLLGRCCTSGQLALRGRPRLGNGRENLASQCAVAAGFGKLST